MALAEPENAGELRRDDRREQWSILSLVIPAMITIVLIILIPLSWLFYLSFLGDDGGFSLENYVKMTQYKSYYRIFITTFQVSIFTTLICIAMGYPLAFFLAQLPPRWSGIFMLAVLLPFLDLASGAHLCLARPPAAPGHHQ